MLTSVVHLPIATGQSGTLSTHICTRVHCAVSSANLRPGVGARRVTEPTAKFSCEMRVVAKAAVVSDGAYRLARAQQLPAPQKAPRLVQAQVKGEFRAGRAAPSKELLEVAQRDSCFGCRFRRAEIRIGKAVLDEAADTHEQLVRIT